MEDGTRRMWDSTAAASKRHARFPHSMGRASEVRISNRPKHRGPFKLPQGSPSRMAANDPEETSAVLISLLQS